MRPLPSALCFISLLFTVSISAAQIPLESEHRRAHEEAAAEAGRQNRAAVNEMAGTYLVPFNAARVMAEIEWCKEHGPADMIAKADKVKAITKKDPAFVKASHAPMYPKLKTRSKMAIAKVDAKKHNQTKHTCGMVAAFLDDPTRIHKMFMTPEEMEAADAKEKK